MADKDSWWKDEEGSSSGNDIADNSIGIRSIQDDAKHFEPRAILEDFLPRTVLSERTKGIKGNK